MLIVKEKSRSQLLKRWTALSTITIQRIAQLVSLIFIHWIVIYPVDSAIQWINYYPKDSTIGFPNIYPLDSDLTGG